MPIQEDMININTFDIDKFEINKFTKDMYNAQKNYQILSTFVNYNNFKGRTIFQCGDINLIGFSGVPKYSEKYHKSVNDPQRCKLQILLDQSQENCKILEDVFKSIDKKINENYNNIFAEGLGKRFKPNKQYYNIVKAPKNDDDEDDDENKGEKKVNSTYNKINRIDFKIPTTKNGDIDLNNFSLYLAINSKNIKLIKNIKTATDLEQYLTNNSIIRPYFYIKNIWCSKQDNMGWGAHVMCRQIIIKKQGKTSNESSYFADSDNDYTIIDDKIEPINDDNNEDNEDNENNENNENNEYNNEDDEDNKQEQNEQEEQEDEQEEEQPQPPKKKDIKKKEEPIPKKDMKNKSKSSNNKSSNKSTKPIQKQVIKNEEDDDDNLQSDEEGEMN